MRKSTLLALILIASFLLNHNPASGQAPPYGLYCASGLHPDGYIDFSSLPPAPPLQGMSTPSAPVTATLPVTGVPGLTATVTIPGIFAAGLQAGPAYSVNGGTLTLNGSPGEGNTALSLNFSQPIHGLGLNVQNPSGRFVYAYSLIEGDGSQPLPAFTTTASGYTNSFLSPRNQSLQMVALPQPPLGFVDANFQKAHVQFTGNPEEFFRSVTFSNLRVQSDSAQDPASSIPTNGLQLWLRSDKGINSAPDVWQDQSGNGHNATSSPGHQPTFSADGRTCQFTWQFNGSSSFFDFNLPIAGWGEMTVFLVANTAKDPPGDTYFSEAAAILWTEDALWGNTFVSPYQTHVYSRFGTTQVGNNLSYTRPASGIGQDFTITRAVHDKDTDQIYVNGLRVLSQGGKLSSLSGVTGAGTIGLGINNKYFNGEISEILVYNRALSSQEAARVESYLRNKYGTQ
ncbi:MAG TPA: LamG-like jellyroll fold domain-containing protein [Edaphobacter sp.]|nr:LamG-like jellyroll fold domain-containing protein [Edaphobacter sp.]